MAGLLRAPPVSIPFFSRSSRSRPALDPFSGDTLSLLRNQSNGLQSVFDITDVFCRGALSGHQLDTVLEAIAGRFGGQRAVPTITTSSQAGSTTFLRDSVRTVTVWFGTWEAD